MSRPDRRDAGFPDLRSSSMTRRALAARLAAAATVAPAIRLAMPSSFAAGQATPAATGVVQAPALPGAQPISGSDRVYTADQSSNTVTVINPATNEVLGTIALGHPRVGGVLGPIDHGQVNVHGLGFSPDGRLLDVISVTSNAAQVIDTATNEILQTFYVGRAPHEGMISPDGGFLWVLVRGQDYVAVIDLASGEEVASIETSPGASKLLFSVDGSQAFVNHLETNELAVIDVASREVVQRIPIPDEAAGSADLSVAPDGEEIWLGHPGTGKTSVVDARELRVKYVLDTGARTNHPNFVTTEEGAFAWVTIGGLNQTKVFRRTNDDTEPELVGTVDHAGVGPHGIWPSPDNTRVYVALQKSDAVDVVDTATLEVVETLRVGQDPQALVYVAGGVPAGAEEAANLTQQGLGMRIENIPIDVEDIEGEPGGLASIRDVGALEEIDVTARGLPPEGTFTVYAAKGDVRIAIMDVTSDASGSVPEALAFVQFFENFDRVILTPKERATATPAG